MATPAGLEQLRHEIRLTAALDHPNILPLKNAEFIQGRLVIAYPLGERTLAERLQHRMDQKVALQFAEQLLDALDYAHAHRIIHCDVKPDNLILFDGDRLRLTDFGISKVAARTMVASGSGTVGYIAPEQAMGRPSFRSDVFSAGLVIYRMLSGELPEWPYDWPPPGYARLRRRIHPDLVGFLRRAIQVNHRKRYANACQMHAAFHRLLPRARRFMTGQRARTNGRGAGGNADGTTVDWRRLRWKEFRSRFHGSLRLDGTCGRCHGPIAEAMQACPWCGTDDRLRFAATRFPARCPRCRRGRKLDWRFCPWCYGAGFDDVAEREYTDTRYTARCANRSCGRRQLMPFMKYCPWCRTKVRRRWPLEGFPDRCPRCSLGVAKGYWRACAWCARRLSDH